MTHTNAASGPLEQHKYGVLFVFAAGILWSTVGLGIRLIEDAVVWQILFYRGESAFVQIRRVGFPAVIAGMALVAAYAGGIYAIQATSVANAMLVFATAPFMAAVLGWVVLKEPVRKATWIAIVVALAGIAIMVADKSVLSSVFLSGLFGVVVTFLICQFLNLSLVLSVRDGGIALGMGVFQVGAGLILYTIGSRSLPAAELTLLSLAEVLLGPLWVWLFLGETATIYTLVGGAVLLAAITGNTISGKRRRPPPIAGP